MLLTETNIRADDYTCGEWTDEKDAAAEFDRRVEASGLFLIFREVWGDPVQPRVGAELKRARIDRILCPQRRLIEMGWTYGDIGVEIKASGLKLGPILVQALDYARVVWEIGDVHRRIMCPWTFIWPLEKQGGPIASVMDQHRIGAAFGHRHCLMAFKTASNTLLRIDTPEQVSIGKCLQGCKAGSR